MAEIPMSLVATENERTILTPEGDLDEVTASGLRQELSSLITNGCRDLVLDLARVRMMDAMGLSLLCMAHTTLQREVGALSIINVSPELDTLLRRAGLSRYVSISPAE
jgi:anti-anti-sigma factor